VANPQGRRRIEFLPDEWEELANVCTICRIAPLSPISVKRGISRCRSCAAKARGMDIEHQRRAGQARGAQLKRAWDAAKSSGLI
jgi:hypothetical protein